MWLILMKHKAASPFLSVISINKSKRNSSVELYRIVATITVLVVHYNGWFVGGMPDRLDLSQLSAFRIGQAVIESASCICVNMFLIISGYFGIRFKGSSLLKICLLLLFIYLPFEFFNACITGDFRIGNFVSGLFMMSRSGYFVQCYLMLMFLSPILNAFIEKHGKRILHWTICLALIEAYFGNIRSIDCLGFGYGYSFMHFLLMYMIARCLYLYKDYLFSIKKVFWVIGYFVCTLLIFVQYVIGITWSFYYSNPICIISAICSFMPFVDCNYNSPIINWIASSTFGVYIIQVTSPAYSYLVKIDNCLLQTQSYAIYLIASLGVIIVFFLLSVIYDKICNIFINPIVALYILKVDGRYEYL